jgi:hypothetical protein
MIPLFPLLEKGKTERGDLLIRELSRAARSLHQKTPSLFERLLQEMEGEEGVAREAWKLLEGRPRKFSAAKPSSFPSCERPWKGFSPRRRRGKGRIFPTWKTP